MMRLLGSVPLGALLAMSCRAPAPPAPRERPPEGEVWLTDAQLKAAQMQIEPSKMVPVAETVSLAGRIAFDDMRVTHVFSPVTGKVGKILAYPGANVKQGAPLAEIDSPDVGNAMSDLLKAQADAETATYELERQKELYEQHATPKKDYEIAANAASRARAELERTRQKMRLLRVDGKGPVTQTFVLRAPLSGEVVTRAVSPGMEVQGQYTGGAVAELFTIGDIDEVWVVADVHEMDVGRVKIGQHVEASVVAYPNQTFPGTVKWTSDVLDPATRTERVRVELANQDRKLRPEMYATLTVTVDERSTVSLPRTALVRLGDLMFVFVAKGQTADGRTRFERRRVTLPVEVPAEGLVPILSGVQVGDNVVVRGAILLSES